jgi:hypothetical protein
MYEIKTNHLYTGDVTEYPEDLIPVLDTFCKEFNFRLPARTKKKGGQFAMWIEALWELKDACGEFGERVIVEYRKDFMAYMQSHGGLAPHTVCSPKSLVNVCRGKAATMRAVPEVRGGMVEDAVAAFMRR